MMKKDKKKNFSIKRERIKKNITEKDILNDDDFKEN